MLRSFFLPYKKFWFFLGMGRGTRKLRTGRRLLLHRIYHTADVYFKRRLFSPCNMATEVNPKNAIAGWEESSVSKVLAVHTWEPKPNPKNPHKTKKNQVQFQVLRIREAETGGSLELAGRAA